MLYRYAIALTGGIATGKSSAADIFRGLGYEIIDADEIAHNMLDRQSDKIIDMFGPMYVDKNRVNRKALGMLVFDDDEKRQALEEMLHPLIRDEIEEMALSLDGKQQTYIVDVPLFYETNRYNIKDVIVVYTPEKIQIQRLMARDSLLLQEAQQRIDAQMDIEQKKDKATYLIDNSGTKDELTQRCWLIDRILKER